MITRYVFRDGKIHPKCLIHTLILLWVCRVRMLGVTYKERVDHGIYAVYVRGSKNCKVHLGKIVNLLATSLGDSGCGNDKACGVVVPKPKKILTELNKKIK